MHPSFEKANQLSAEAIGAAIEVHRDKGAGLIESIYEICLKHELKLRNISFDTQQSVEISYKDLTFEHPLRYDILIEDCLLLELKSVEKILPIHKAQLLSYMKLLNVPIGLLFNLKSLILKNDMHRMILPGAAPS